MLHFFYKKTKSSAESEDVFEIVVGIQRKEEV